MRTKVTNIPSLASSCTLNIWPINVKIKGKSMVFHLYLISLRELRFTYGCLLCVFRFYRFYFGGTDKSKYPFLNVVQPKTNAKCSSVCELKLDQNGELSKDVDELLKKVPFDV